MPTVAIAGSGDVSIYLAEELRRRATLSRTISGVEQKVVDFTSVPRLREAIGDAEALVSAIGEYTMVYAEIHINMIEACKASPKCRRFMPSEFVGNMEDYPDLPMSYICHEPVRRALREQDKLEFTLLSTSWFMDYVVPAKNRYLRDLGDAFVINYAENCCVIPGTGKEMVAFVAVRDVAQAVVHLLRAPLGTWEQYTYLSGEKTTMPKLAERLRNKHKIGLDDVRHVGLGKMIQAYAAPKTEEEGAAAELQIFTVSGAADLDSEKVAAQRAKYFSGMHFRSVQELLDEADENPDVIV